MKKPWYQDSEEPGVIQLCHMFKVHMAEFFRDANKYRDIENKATKKGHKHIHRPAGSKMLKRHNRYEWEQWVKKYDTTQV